MNKESIFKIRNSSWIDLSHIVSISDPYFTIQAPGYGDGYMLVGFKIHMMFLEKPMTFNNILSPISDPEYLDSEGNVKLIDGTSIYKGFVIREQKADKNFITKVAAVADTQKVINEIVVAWKKFKGEAI